MALVRKSSRRLKDGRVVPVAEHVRKSSKSFASIEIQAAGFKAIAELEEDGRPVPSKSFLRLLDRNPFLSRSTLRNGVSSLSPSERQIATVGFAHTSYGWHVASCPKRSRFGRGAGFPESEGFGIAKCCGNLRKEMNKARDAMNNDNSIELLNKTIPFDLDNVPSELREAWKRFPEDAKKIVHDEILKALEENMDFSDEIRNRIAAVRYLADQGETGVMLAKAVVEEESPEQALGKAVKQMARSNLTKDVNAIRTEFNTMYQEMLEEIEVPSDIENASETPLALRVRGLLFDHSEAVDGIYDLLEEARKMEAESEKQEQAELSAASAKSIHMRGGAAYHVDAGHMRHVIPLKESDATQLEKRIVRIGEIKQEIEEMVDKGKVYTGQVDTVLSRLSGSTPAAHIAEKLNSSSAESSSKVSRIAGTDTPTGFIITALLYRGYEPRRPAFVT